MKMMNRVMIGASLIGQRLSRAVIVSGMAAGELGRPTPCPEYDVAALIDHLVEAGRRAAAFGRRRVPSRGAVRGARSATQRRGRGGTGMGRRFQLVAAAHNALG